MPEMVFEPRTFNDRSALTNGWHPAYLIEITDEATPEGWQMYSSSPRMWRWIFSVWQHPDHIQSQPPERQSAPSSQKFAPKGRQPASKAYLWTTALLGRNIEAGERVNLDPLMPIPCRVKVERKEEYANIIDLELWEEGKALLNDSLKKTMAALLEDGRQQPVHTPQSAPAPATSTPAWGAGGNTPPRPMF